MLGPTQELIPPEDVPEQMGPDPVPSGQDPAGNGVSAPPEQPGLILSPESWARLCWELQAQGIEYKGLNFSVWQQEPSSEAKPPMYGVLRALGFSEGEIQDCWI